MEMTSCQVTGIAKSTWIRFRQKCLSEGISANGKVRSMIEAEVSSMDGAGESNMRQGMKGEDDERNQPGACTIETKRQRQEGA
jgi:hypothetical protein